MQLTLTSLMSDACCHAALILIHPSIRPSAFEGCCPIHTHLDGTVGRWRVVASANKGGGRLRAWT